jgi:tight adherence protein C
MLIALIIALCACACVAVTIGLVITSEGPAALANVSGGRLPKGRASFYDRVVVDLVARATKAGRRYTPQGMIENLELKLAHAGYRGDDELDRFLAIRVGTVFASVVMFVIGVLMAKKAFEIPGLKPVDGAAAFILFALVALILPEANLNKKISERQKAISRSFSDFLDILTISVEAGLGFDQAIIRIAETTDGPLSDEIHRMNGEMLAGASRATALKAMEERIGLPEIKSFVLTVVQADEFGVSISDVLRSQSEELRVARHQQAQEAAQKAPVKMLLPMTFFIFPALFAVVLAPALINIINNFA